MKDSKPEFDAMITSSFSGTVMVRTGKEIAFQSARGYANRSDYVPNVMETRFSLASVGKTFTAVTILQLVEEGWFSLDDDILDILPEGTFLHVTKGVTVHHLLTHTSGMPDYFDESEQDDYESLWDHRPVYKMRKAIDFLPMYNTLPMKENPGTVFRYNNTGFLVLAMIIEQFSGKSFAETVNERVFAKAGMTYSGYFAFDHMPSKCATGYRDVENGWVSNIYDIPPIGGGDGGAWSNAQDLLKFWDALLEGVLLGPTMTSLMLKKHVDVAGDDAEGYGYGLWLKSIGNSNGFFLQGCDPGASAVSLYDPLKNNAFVVLSNTSGGVWDICAELIRIFSVDSL